MAGLEGLTADRAGQWLRVAWYMVLLAYHRRERPEYNELFELIQASARGSKFRDKMEGEDMVESMATVGREAGMRLEGSANVTTPVEH